MILLLDKKLKVNAEIESLEAPAVPIEPDTPEDVIPTDNKPGGDVDDDTTPGDFDLDSLSCFVGL